jgi:four helix bundle protein
MDVIHSYKDLIVWQKAVDLVLLVYTYTDGFPPAELYGLISQMKRCVVSIPSNIAEGRRRGTRKDYRQFLTIAFGSAAELDTQLIIAKRLNYGSSQLRQQCELLVDEVMRMLNAILNKMQPDKTNLNSS